MECCDLLERPDLLDLNDVLERLRLRGLELGLDRLGRLDGGLEAGLALTLALPFPGFKLNLSVRSILKASRTSASSLSRWPKAPSFGMEMVFGSFRGLVVQSWDID